MSDVAEPKIPSWATGTCNAHKETPHAACHKCNKEIVRIKDQLDSRTHALRQAVEMAEESTLPLPTTIDKWRHYLGMGPSTDEEE